MPQDQFRIFLSAVTSEFGRARDAVAADLRSREALLRVQSDFRQEAGSDTTLKKLHDYIRDCSAVVCVIGKRSGALPLPKATEPFAHLLPSGIAKASYTQWEFFFARHFKRRLAGTDDTEQIHTGDGSRAREPQNGSNQLRPDTWRVGANQSRDRSHAQIVLEDGHQPPP